MASPNKSGKCVNGYCEIPGRTFTMGSPDRVGAPREHPQRQVTLSTQWLRRTEVTVDEYNAHLAKQGLVDLKIVLSGCSSLDSSRVVVKGEPGESEASLLKRAREIAGQTSCSTDPLKVDRKPRQAVVMEGWCGKLNRQGGDHPVVCVDQKEAEDFCASEGATLPSEALIESASRGPSGTAEFGNPIETAAIYHHNFRKQFKPGDAQLGTQPVCGENNETEGPFGVCDLAGNAWERTSTRYVSYSDPIWSSNPTDPNPSLEVNEDGSYKRGQAVVFRGGSVFNLRVGARAALRGVFPDGRSLYDVGFRCARRGLQDSKK